MKKALSVLLVAAALFGFYGSAVTVNDLLACKDYWEEAGEKSTADMNKLEDGLNQLMENEEAYLDGIDQVAEGEKTLAQGEADYAAAPGKLAKGKAELAAGWAAYKAGKKEYDAGKKEYNSKKKEFDKIVYKFNELTNEKSGYPAWERTYVEKLTETLTSGDSKKAACFEGGYSTINYGKSSTPGKPGTGSGAAGGASDAVMTAIGALSAYASVWESAGANAAALTNSDDKMGTLKTIISDLEKDIDAIDPSSLPDEDQQAAATAKKTAMGQLKTALETQKDDLEFYGTLMGLVDARKKIYDDLVPVIEKMATDDEVKKKLDSLGGLDGIKLALSNDGKMFIGAMDKLIPFAQNVIDDNSAKLAAANKKLKDAKGQLAAGLKKLRKGEADYAQGLADYEAAPAQLEDGRQQLADGKAQLAQYEDGEQQIRDGLATLFNTEADLDLVSIADRLNGDGDFDNGDEHLEIEEGLNAVEVGRGYQAEDGVLITNEIMGRAVATGGLIGAAVLAVLAAILSFLKKNKGAAVFAILAAAAGAFGAFYGPAQGTYFSDIAGSTVGATTWVAAGVLGAVALVHAIAHFAAPKNA